MRPVRRLASPVLCLSFSLSLSSSPRIRTFTSSSQTNLSLRPTVYAFWDIENCSIIKKNNSCKPHSIPNLLTSLLRSNEIQNEIVIYAFGDIKHVSLKDQIDLYDKGVFWLPVQGGKKDTADKFFMSYVANWIVKNPPPTYFIMITGDIDYANILIRMRRCGYNVILIHLRSASKSLLQAATITWEWEIFSRAEYESHWLIIMGFPKDPSPTAVEMIETYIQTAAKVFGSVEEAKKKIYAFSTTTYRGFQVIMPKEESVKFKGLPGVLFVLPDTYINLVNKEYGGDKYDNGVISLISPPIQYGRQGRYGDRNKNSHWPRYHRPRKARQMPQGSQPYDRQGPMQGDGRNYAPQQYDPPGYRRDHGPPGQARDFGDGNQGMRGDPMPSYSRDPNQGGNFAPRREFSQGQGRDQRYVGSPGVGDYGQRSGPGYYGDNRQGSGPWLGGDYRQGSGPGYSGGYRQGSTPGYRQGSGPGYGGGYQQGSGPGYDGGNRQGSGPGYGGGYRQGSGPGYGGGNQQGSGPGYQQGLGPGNSGDIRQDSGGFGEQKKEEATFGYRGDYRQGSGSGHGQS